MTKKQVVDSVSPCRSLKEMANWGDTPYRHYLPAKKPHFSRMSFRGVVRQVILAPGRYRQGRALRSAPTMSVSNMILAPGDAKQGGRNHAGSLDAWRQQVGNRPDNDAPRYSRSVRAIFL